MADNETKCLPSKREDFEWKKSLFKIDFMFGINDFDIEKDTKMPSEAVEQGMDDDGIDEIDGVKCHTHSDASIGGKKGDLEFLGCKQVLNHGGDELGDKRRPMKRKRVYAD
ncbi:hypothetical protein Tco_1511195 [Tanacetum coccineum]